MYFQPWCVVSFELGEPNSCLCSFYRYQFNVSSHFNVHILRALLKESVHCWREDWPTDCQTPKLWPRIPSKVLIFTKGKVFWSLLLSNPWLYTNQLNTFMKENARNNNNLSFFYPSAWQHWHLLHCSVLFTNFSDYCRTNICPLSNSHLSPRKDCAFFVTLE